MNNPLVNQAAMVLPVFLLSACLGGGGSFDLDSVDTEAPRPAPKYQDVPSKKPEARKDQGGYGFAMRFKRRNWYGSTKEDRVKLNESDWEQTDNGGIKNPSKQKSIIDALTGNDGETLQDSSQEGQSISKVEGYHDFKYVWSGFFYKRIGRTIKKDDSSSKIIEVRNGPDGYIFYKGKNPSRQLPVLGQVTYKGTWNFLTDVKANQKFTDLGNTSTKPGDRYSAFPGELDYIVKKEDDKKEKHKGLGLTTEITVDFENKTLKGKLVKNNHVINDNSDDQNKYTTEYYTLDATLRGNRFSGKAMATDKSKNGETGDQTKKHPFVSDSFSLSGGFFGPQGKELGFRFLSDDGKVAVVGSAKTGDKAENGGGNGASGGASVSVSNGAAGTSSENGKLTTVLDAVELTPDGKEIKNLDNFSNATRLVVDGIMIPLLPTESGDGQADKGENGKTAFIYETTYTPESDEKNTQAQTGAGGMQTVSNAAGGTSGETKTYKVQACCSNLNYLKYGLLTRKTAGNTGGGGKGSQAAAQTAQGARSMFLQGERTDENKIPQGQDIVYRGSWYGYIVSGTSWSGNASNATSGNRAEFTVNFDAKKINGKLTAENRSEATFTIDAMIDGNGFKGTAKTGNGGFAPDQNSSTGTHKVHITSAAVQGGFYGPKAEELGGWFAYPGNGQTKNAQTSSGNGNSAGSATVVFGAKRQELVQ
ncbi:TPA: transferrin-binding protein-like solute binding protein [Neisseria gonorrhoeae]|uniref:transferrin-binding protein-like solute binding protein n=4 Tax=Neisseria gonorrhoeae TaxID=485 RepID=UPI0001F6F46A|nr:transferrin-binding protein-like solute binding protein [Neisseria gonorrhoeae]KLS51198.1 Transferrin-binding protein 2 [Neisseria gonorrhoeae MU_NG3]MCU9883365.1 transferrin-binding protein-like solute binding protein [Neisseria gonorrhoeae]MDO6057834.1 transferrin-binding protein-like solute binding protein [Neisseria gonorrhoeae]MDO6089495.1 transferrin-binding protein-like solute binding protein [Neisseria gonorrhoeae]UYK41936.1 transferrin-binding protein-like solute binding protein [N